MDERVQAAIAYMKANLHRQLSVNELACLVNLSASHLAYLFRRETGQSAFRYLLNLRLERGRELLEAATLNIKQIAAQVGQSSNHFSENFRRRYNVTPSQFAERRRSQTSRRKSSVS